VSLQAEYAIDASMVEFVKQFKPTAVMEQK
jgi:hypothetical protein